MDALPVAPTATLLERAAQGEPSAVRELLDGVGPTVYGFVFARVGGNQQAAEDLTQETLVEACRSAHTYRGEATLATWVCAIARRRIGRYFERERREELTRSSLTLVRHDDGVEAGHDVDQRDELVRALGRVPVVQRQVLVLKYLDGRTVAEIAEALNRSPVQIQSLLQRGRDSLRDELGEHR